MCRKIIKTNAYCIKLYNLNIIFRKHYNTALIYDESGPVLISYPISFQERVNQDRHKISLLHIGSFYAQKCLRTIFIEPEVKDKKGLIIAFQSIISAFSLITATKTVWMQHL